MILDINCVSAILILKKVMINGTQNSITARPGRSVIFLLTDNG